VRRKPPSLPSEVFGLALRCSCGSTLTGGVAAPFRDAMTLRDVFLSFHRRDGCTVTDESG